MITNWYYDNTGDREFIRKTVKDNNFSTIDIGGGRDGIFRDCINACVDINDIVFSVDHFYKGNINYPEVWNEIANKSFDYAICTMTLEDICNPIFVANQISRIAKRGVIIVPSKYRELTRNIHGPYRGFIHHHSIFDIVSGVIIGYPKLNLIEQTRFDPPDNKTDLTELIIEWEGEIPIKEVNDGFLGPTHADVEGYYDRLLQG